MKKKISSIDEYIKSAARESRQILNEIRAEVRRRIPSAIEVISYNMPAFKDEKMFFYFAAFKNHIGIYPPLKDPDLRKKLKPYMNEKGNLAFPLSDKIPIKLIGRIAVALQRE